MPPPRLIDLAQHDLGHICLSKEQIYEQLPHRHEFQLLDGFCVLDKEARHAVAFADIHPDAWWVRGHVEGRTLLPGVLMLEMAAQASAILTNAVSGNRGFLGLGGLDGCKFRDAIAPPARLYILCVDVDRRPRRFICDTQGICNDKLVFQARITGMAM